MGQCTLSLTRNVDYAEQNGHSPKRRVLLLHGYQQRGETILKLLGPCFDEDTHVIAPNGFFPMAYRAGNNFRLGYTWYFFDPATGVYAVPMDPALTYLETFWATLDLPALPLTVVGYSQGGYLTPFAAERLGAERAVGVNSRFRDEDLARPLSFRVDAVHGDKDPLVDPQRSKASHGRILEAGNRGVFSSIAGAGHRIDDQIREGLRRAL